MEERKEELIESEYKTWRKNVKYLYDLVFTQSLTWPSPTVQWFPDVERHKNENVSHQRILLSTYTQEQAEQEHILIAKVGFPDTVTEEASENAAISFAISQNIPVPVEINKSKYCPQAPNIIACKTESPDILIYDYTKHESYGSTKEPETVLTGHTKGGFALDWNKVNFGQLVSGGEDCKACLFDINNGLVHDYGKLHSSIVNGVSFHSFNPNIFATGSDDKKLTMIDTRKSDTATILKEAHASSVEGVDFSPFKAELIATCSSDNTIKVWDSRSMNTPLYTLRGHKNDVMNVKWSLHYESILASSSKDRRVNIWDLNKSAEANGEASSELLFVHGGHTDTAVDFDWNPAEPIEICSIDDSNMLHVWKIPIEEHI